MRSESQIMNDHEFGSFYVQSWLFLTKIFKINKTHSIRNESEWFGSILNPLKIDSN